jgi:hypothetical protein
MSELSTALDCLAVALHWLDEIDGIPSSVPGRTFVVNAALLALHIRAEPGHAFGIDLDLGDDERALSALFKADIELGKLIEKDVLDQHERRVVAAARLLLCEAISTLCDWMDRQAEKPDPRFTMTPNVRKYYPPIQEGPR